MFTHKLRVEVVSEDGKVRFAPLAWLDSFAMRSFTNDAAFDDTLPIADGLLEAGSLVSQAALAAAMEGWFHRKRRLAERESIRVTELKGKSGRL